MLIDHGVNIVLNGHKHVSNAWKVEDMIILTSGTATTWRLHADTHPSYNQLIIKDEILVTNLVRTETGQKKHLASYSLNSKIKSNENISMTPLFY